MNKSTTFGLYMLVGSIIGATIDHLWPVEGGRLDLPPGTVVCDGTGASIVATRAHRLQLICANNVAHGLDFRGVSADTPFTVSKVDIINQGHSASAGIVVSPNPAPVPAREGEKT